MDDYNYLELISKRYSCRSFTNEKIKKSELNYILKAGSLAPSAVNFQPQKIYVVESDDLLDKLHEEFRGSFNALTILVVCYDKDIAWVRKNDGKCFGDVDAAICATHMMLACEALNIGCCYVCAFNEKRLREILEIDERYSIHCMLPIGYKNDEPKEKIRKDLSDTIIYR